MDQPGRAGTVDGRRRRRRCLHIDSLPLLRQRPGCLANRHRRRRDGGLIDTGVSDDVQESFYDTFDTAGSARSNAAANVRVQWVSARPELSATEDGFGHGSHVGGVIAGFSSETNPIGKYTGIAPEANILSVRIADDAGNATGGDLMAGLEYVDDNRDAYNIRVLNLSVSSSIA
ncbi:MAG: S8 family serine peptidase [Chloroflexi bacterium]|nr:S8 family serine peptidase [Chloroflexota bacterium]